jgi:hypothetical protein
MPIDPQAQLIPDAFPENLGPGPDIADVRDISIESELILNRLGTAVS